ncbi:notch 1 intracellular domain like protein isoform 1 [Tanacetum coccineum]
MVGVQTSLPCTWSLGGKEHVLRSGCRNLPCFSDSGLGSSGSKSLIFQRQYIVHGSCLGKRCHPICSSKMDDGTNEDESSDNETDSAKNEFLRENLERLIGVDDSAFSGIDLATLIRKKYGRSYDVQLIKKEFMGKNFLAMNVMWKYMEQRSFPLTEEEYLLRLDDVANTLKCWGAVSHIRNSLEKLKERPRIGKVSGDGEMGRFGNGSKHVIFYAWVKTGPGGVG